MKRNPPGLRAAAWGGCTEPLFPPVVYPLAFREKREIRMPAKKSGTIDWESPLAGIGRGKTNLEYGADRRIFDQGQPAESIFYIRKDKVKLSVISRHGKDAIVATLGAGGFLGDAPCGPTAPHGDSCDDHRLQSLPTTQCETGI
jgi:hypothetical protein